MPLPDSTAALQPRLLRNPWLHPLNDAAAIDDLLALVNPAWSLTRIRARVQRVVIETADTRTFVLRPNRRWRGHRAGQHVAVEVEIDGVRHHRTYSLSSAPGTRECAITVRRQPQGRVSNWLHDRVKAGDVLTLSAPAGEFTLPQVPPARLLMLGAGSGMTPLMAMLRDLHARGHAGDVVLVHCSRDRGDAIFGAELRALAGSWPALQLIEIHTRAHGRPDAASLRRLVPDYADRHTLMCGPAGFMTAVLDWYRSEGLETQLQYESFGVPLPVAADGAGVQVVCRRSERGFDASSTSPLLVEAERAGMRPKHGCRIGVCRSCQCRKLAGTVRNLRTGALSSEPGELIQLCINAAASDLELDL